MVCWQGCIYACGGELEGGDPSSALQMLDPRVRAWARLPDMTTSVAFAGAAVVSGRMYVPGGWTDYRDVVHACTLLQCYDVVAGRWDTGCAAMAVARER